MGWKLAGQRYDDVRIPGLASALQETLDNQMVNVAGETYLIRSGYLIPYFDPHGSGTESTIRGRLNIELCQRIIRESEVRHVSRSVQDADAEIAMGMARYKQNGIQAGRGEAVILFQNIVNRIRELSQEYLDYISENITLSGHSEKEIQIQEHIRELYEFVMVENQEIMQSVRRFDGSEDVDGTIREMFSELGKPHRVPLSLIYEGRVTKIGRAMSAIDAVATCMTTALAAATGTPKSHAISCIAQYVSSTKRISSIPSSDHAIFNEAAAFNINARDMAEKVVEEMEYLHLQPEDRQDFVNFILRGIFLIYDMHKLRDERSQSVKDYREQAEIWADGSRYSNRKAQ